MRTPPSGIFGHPTRLIPGQELVSITCALDLADLVPADSRPQLATDENRTPNLARWSICQPSGLWQTESEVIDGRTRETRRLRGKVIWDREFQERHAGLLRADGDAVLRLARNGAIAGTYVSRLDKHRSAYELVETLQSLREAARTRFRRAVLDLFPDTATVTDYLSGPSMGKTEAAPIECDSLDPLMMDYTLIAVRRFTSARGRKISLDTVLRSDELAGIFNETFWFSNYGDRHRDFVQSRALGYRQDEVLLVGRKSMVVVCERIWSTEDSLRLYYQDLVLMIQHYLCCGVHLRQLLTTTRTRLGADQFTSRPVESIAHDVLALRLDLMAVQAALDEHTLINHGFTRTLVERLRVELGIEKSLRLIEDWLSTSEAIGLRESILAAQRSSALAARNNILQTTAVALAIIALLVSVVIGLMT